MRKILLAGAMVLAMSGAALANPVANVVRVDGDAPVIDGVMDDAAWVNAAKENSKVVMDTNWDAQRIWEQHSDAYLTYDDKYLYIGVVNYVSNAKELDPAGNTWGQFDGMEACWQIKGDEGNVYTVYAYPGGQSEVKMGKGEGDTDTLAKGIKVKATIGNTHWDAEYAIPLKEAGIDTKKPLYFNLGVLKKAEGAWTQWISTGGNTTNVELAGILSFK